MSTFRWAAEEARRFSGELQRLDTDPAATGRIALVRRVPRGPVLGIAPFNFPLNLVAHKVAPALAVGAPIIVKPAPATPLSALLLGEILAETELPTGMFSVLPLPNERAAELVADPRLPVVSFTGSGPVGAAIRRPVPEKHVTLELGGNAAAVICEDWASDEDLDLRRPADRHLRQLPGRAVLHRRAAGPTCTNGSTTRFLPRLVAAVRGAADRRPGRRVDRRRAAGLRRGGRSGSRRGSTRRSPPGPPSRSGAGATAPPIRPPC